MKSLVFVLGHVIGLFDHALVTRRLAPHAGIPADAIHTLLWNSPLEDDYDSGRIGTAEFLQYLRQACRLTCTDEELATAYSDIFWPNADVIALLPRLKPSYRILLASNTNELHARQFLTQFDDCLRCFDAVVLSYQVGVRKPRPEFFEQCQRLAGCAPQDGLFIDDLPANVAGAQACGWHGIVYRSIDDLRSRLAEHGVTES